MSKKNLQERRDVFEGMNSGTPFTSYRKVILGQVLIKYWDNFTETPQEMVIKGDPNSDFESCIIDVWSEPEKVYFERANRKHFEAGVLIPHARSENPEPQEKPLERYSDEELAEIINSKFFSFTAILNKVEKEAVLFRMKTIAQELEKSEKIVKAIEARLSEVQLGDTPVKEE